MIDTLIWHINTINLLYAVAGLGLLAITTVLAYDYSRNDSKWFALHVEKCAWPLIILLTWSGAVTTLLYSEVFDFVPCSLCWLQRVALYSQALMALAAWRVRDRVFFPLYGMVLSAFGVVVAVYQYIYQAIPDDVREGGLMPCLADGSADCSKTVMEVFGFVTFPFLSAVIFLSLIVLFMHLRRLGK